MRKLTTTVGIYILGWLTLVPYCVWQLCTNATKDNLALLIMLPVGWILFYFPIVVPLLSAWKIRQLMKLLDDPEKLVAKLREVKDGEGRERVIDFIARENGVPKFVIRWLYRRIEPHLQQALAPPSEADAELRPTADEAPEPTATAGAPERRY